MRTHVQIIRVLSVSLVMQGAHLKAATPGELTHANSSRAATSSQARASNTLTREEVANYFFDRTSKDEREHIIQALANVPEDHLTRDFIDIAKDLFKNRETPTTRADIIVALGNVPADRFKTTFMNYIRLPVPITPSLLTNLSQLQATFTNEEMDRLKDSIPLFDILRLINRVSEMQPEQYQAEIEQTIAQYQHNAGAGVGRGAAFEVHNYANTQVNVNSSNDTSGSSGSSSSSSRSSSPTMRLDDAVMQQMQTKLQAANTPTMEYQRARVLLKSWIEKKYANAVERQQAEQAAFSKLASDVHYNRDIAVAVTFLQKFHPNKIDLWLDGFLTESMSAYEKSANSTSCTKGISERIATGMRGIDAELNKLFAQAEGPTLAKAFMAGLNIDNTQRCRAITHELVKLGLTENSTPKQAGEIMETYMRKSLDSYGVSADAYASQIKTMKELVAAEGGFETYIKPALEAFERERVRKEQDQAYEETLKADSELENLAIKPQENSNMQRYREANFSSGSSSSSPSSGSSSLGIMPPARIPTAVPNINPTSAPSAATLSAAPKLSKEEERAARIRVMEQKTAH